ncbi:hypothetical protein BsWGS_18517 [Bradybaena similaris]
MAAESSDTSIGKHLLLTGRTGNGKRSTGNSILGVKEFTPQSCTSSAVTYEIKAATKKIDGDLITVVEGPGLGDTDIDVTDDGQSMIELSEKALTLISYTLHALLVVLKYGCRFTNQEKEAVKMIKAIFGEDVIKNYGIIVMTYGDSFDMDMEVDGVTFAVWCDDQTGDVRVLFDECDKRCVLFDNRSKDHKKVGRQRQQLLKLVSGIMQCRPPYSYDDYMKAEPSRRSLFVRGKLPTLGLKTEIIISNINSRLDKLKEQQKIENINDLQKLSDELQEHKLYLEKEDEGTNLIEFLLIQLRVVEMRITTMMNTHKMTEELQKHTISEREDTARVTKVSLKEKIAGLVSFLFYGHWSVIQYVACYTLGKIPKHCTIVSIAIEKLFDCYSFLWSLVLPNTVMEDKRLIAVRNQIKAAAAPFRARNTG